MESLAILEIKNYTDQMKVLERTHARAVICKNNKYAMQRSKRGEYKFPGGRLEEGETPKDALVREIKEETGLYAISSSIQEIGEITEIRRDVYEEDTKYICHSLYYRCEVEEQMGTPTPSQNELEKGYELVWAELEDMIQENKALNLEESRIRDTVFMEMLRDGKV